MSIHLVSESCYVTLFFGDSFLKLFGNILIDSDSVSYQKEKDIYFNFYIFLSFPCTFFFKERSIIEKFTAWRVKSTLNFTLKTDITRIAFLESHNWIKIRKKHTLIVLFVFILSARPQKAISKSTVRTVITSANRKQALWWQNWKRWGVQGKALKV